MWWEEGGEGNNKVRMHAMGLKNIFKKNFACGSSPSFAMAREFKSVLTDSPPFPAPSPAVQIVSCPALLLLSSIIFFRVLSSDHKSLLSHREVSFIFFNIVVKDRVLTYFHTTTPFVQILYFLFLFDPLLL